MAASSAHTVIIGAGSAGSLLAERLSQDPSREVLVLEAGQHAPAASEIPALWTSMFNSEVDWGFHTEPQPSACMRRIYSPRGKMVGGSGAINAMICMRGLPSDYEGWREAGCAGWGWQDVKPYFLRIERNSRDESEHHSSHGPIDVTDVGPLDPIEQAWMDAAQACGVPHNEDFNGARQEGVGCYQLNIRNGERVSTASALLVPALARRNLRLETGARVLRLLMRGHRVCGVEYLCRGRLERVEATGEVVVCAGAVGTPHIMLLSGIGPAQDLQKLGVEVRLDLPGVGRNLLDHPHLSTTWSTHRALGLAHLDEPARARNMALWTASRSGPYASNGSRIGACVRSAPSVVDPDLQLYCTISANRSHGRFLAMEPGITLSATLQRPKSVGRIALRSGDPLQDPLIDPAYFSDPDQEDVAALVRALRWQRMIAAREPLRAWLKHESPISAHCQSDSEIAGYVRAHCMTIFHLSGSCRMGVDGDAVVDPATMRVHGVDGLCVVDASVFPKMVSGNIHTPVMMVAEKAADLLRTGNGAPAAGMAAAREGA